MAKRTALLVVAVLAAGVVPGCKTDDQKKGPADNKPPAAGTPAGPSATPGGPTTGGTGSAGPALPGSPGGMLPMSRPVLPKLDVPASRPVSLGTSSGSGSGQRMAPLPPATRPTTGPAGHGLPGAGWNKGPDFNK
jgi:hypothetical protein